MKDIVEEAIENAESADRADELDGDTSSTGFGEPELSLVGFGRVGAELLQREWMSDYPDVETHHRQRGDERQHGSIDTDYTILVGSTDEHELAAAIGERLPAGTTSVAVPISTPESPAASVETANATIPCPRAYADELVGDLLAVLSGRTWVSPPPQFYTRLRTAGRVNGFRGRRERADSQPDLFAERLVTDALGNPFDTGDTDASDHLFSLFRADDAVTLETFDAVRNEVTDRFGTDTGTESFAVDTTADTGAAYRLTLLRH